MSKNYAFKADKRDRAGKGVARALRRENKVPGVIYGDNKEAIAITLPEKEVHMEYHKGQMFTTLCDLDVSGDKHLVLARDVQLHPVSDKVLHVDFLRVSPRTKISVQVPVVFINHDDCPALQEKGIMNTIRYEVELTCRATNIPDSIEVDLTPFNIGDAIKMSDITLPDGAVPTITDRDLTIAALMAPRSMEEEIEEVEGEEGAEGEEVAEGEEAAEGEAAEGGAAEGDKK